MVRVVEVAIRRFYRVFVEDENSDMTDEQITTKAKEMILDDESNLDLDQEIEIEEQDILHLFHHHDID